MTAMRAGAAGLRGLPSWAQLLLLLLVLCVGALLLAEQSPSNHTFTITTLINVTLVVGIYIFVGNSGIVSFGHMSFMALSAYGTGLLTLTVVQKDFLLPDLPHFLASVHMATFPALLVVVAAVALVAAVVGLPLMRLAGIASSIATLALLIIVYVVISQSEAITGGAQPFLGIPLTTTTGVALAGAVVAICTAFLFDRTSLALRLRASREDEPAARAAGISVVREREIAFILSAAVVAIGGAVYAHFLGVIEPKAFYFDLTFITIAMLVVGGMRSLSGAVVGAIVISSIQEGLGRLESGEGLGPIHFDLRDGATGAVLALIVVAVLIYRPGGIVAGGARKRTATPLAADAASPDGRG